MLFGESASPAVIMMILHISPVLVNNQILFAYGLFGCVEHGGYGVFEESLDLFGAAVVYLAVWEGEEASYFL